MKIEHIAIWVSDLDKMRDFYIQFFGAIPGEKYINPIKEFSSYFLSFTSGCRLEIMHRPDIQSNKAGGDPERMGLTHFAMSVGSKELVNELTERLRTGGYEVIGEPRTTGDGYFESVVGDPEGNRIEITI